MFSVLSLCRKHALKFETWWKHNMRNGDKNWSNNKFIWAIKSLKFQPHKTMPRDVEERRWLWIEINAYRLVLRYKSFNSHMKAMSWNGSFLAVLGAVDTIKNLWFENSGKL